MTKNPIQTVLEAEAMAKKAIESARQEAEARRQAAHAEARAIIERNEVRTQRAIRHYEERCAAQLAKQIEALAQEAQITSDRFASLVDEHVDDIVEEAFVRLWPQS